MNNLVLDTDKSNELLRSALKNSPVLKKLLDKDRPRIVSIWKPSMKVHVADILVARVISALTFLGADVTVYFSNWMREDTPTKEDEEKRAASRFYYSFFSELYHKFCGGDKVHLKRFFSTESMGADIPFPPEAESVYEAFKKDPPEKIKHKVTEKIWPLKKEYMGALLSVLLTDPKPDGVICGEKHEWIWKRPFLLQILEDAKVPLPHILYVKNISVNDGKPLREEDDNCIFVTSGRSEILQCLGQWGSLRTCDLILKLIEWLCLPIGFCPVVGNGLVHDVEGWRTAYGNEEDYVAAATGLVWGSLSEIRNTAKLHERLVLPYVPLRVTNRVIADYVEGELEFGRDFFGSDRELDTNPDKWQQEYLNASRQILDTLGNGTVSDLDSLKALIVKSECVDRLQNLFRKRQRDHFSHQFNVYGLGVLLLRAVVSRGGTLREIVSERVSLSPEEVDAAWAIAALFHDHAYPLQYLFGLQPRMQALHRANKDTGLEDIYNALKQAIPDMYVEKLWPEATSSNNESHKLLQDTWFELTGEKNIPSALSGNIYRHGLISASNIFVRLTRGHGKKIAQSMKMALLAIARHDLGDTVSFDNEPLCALLRLCDELHEWGRPVFFKNNHNCPIEAITINLTPRIDGKYDMPRVLEVGFQCRDLSILEDISWKSDLFSKGKRAAIDNIKFFADGQHPAAIKLFMRAQAV